MAPPVVKEKMVQMFYYENHGKCCKTLWKHDGKKLKVCNYFYFFFLFLHAIYKDKMCNYNTDKDPDFKA